MLVQTDTQLVLQCGLCEASVTTDISAFAFKNCNSLSISCDCGFRVGEVAMLPGGRYELRIACISCGKLHHYMFSRQDFFDMQLHAITCKENKELELGCLGPQIMQPQLKEQECNLNAWVNEYGYDDYFDAPDVMMAVLNCLYEITNRKGIYCSCGNHKINIKICSDRIFFSCPACQRDFWLLAQNRTDIGAVEKMEEIILR